MVFYKTEVFCYISKKVVFMKFTGNQKKIERGDIPMKCTKCGATLLDTDQFCNKCGAKVVRQKRCPDCGTVLRDGTLFCPGCGKKVGEVQEKEVAKGETLDIPIEVIERNILSETAAEMLTDDRKRNAMGKRETQSIPAKKKPTPEPPVRKKRPVYEEAEEDEEDWDDEEDFEEEEWDDDEDEEGPDILTIMTIIIGCVLLVVAVFIGYHFYRQYVPKDYGEVAEEMQEEQEAENSEETDAYAGTLRIRSNVNVRTSPSTEGTSVIMVAKQDETYHYYNISEDGNWYCIALEGKGGTYDRGYVFADYVTIE